MNRIKIILIVTFLLNIVPVWAQSTAGTEFWLTFGQNRGTTAGTVGLKIRIISGDSPCSGTIYFTETKSSVPFTLPARGIYDYTLKENEKKAVYNTETGTTYKSIHITSNNSITVYAMNQYNQTTDATNILPVNVLDNIYYQISYKPSQTNSDAYAVIGTKSNTKLYHNGVLATTLDSGQVYYRTSATDMTGTHIKADNPVAFFALNHGAEIPTGYGYIDNLFQQLLPVSTWGMEFLVPVSHLTRDIVRIVASENNTNITQIGGKLLFPEGGQTKLTDLKAGQFVELEVKLSNNGCFIYANKPVGVCAYLTGGTYNDPTSKRTSDPSQTWISAKNHTVTEVSVAPLLPLVISKIDSHFAIVITATSTKENTQVSISGNSATGLFGGSWIDNTDAKMSFYNMPLKELNKVYHFSNDKGLIVMSYGTGTDESYYFNNYFTLGKNPFAVFFANDFYYLDLLSHALCTPEVVFRAELSEPISSPGSLKWFIDDVEELSARDQITWSKSFPMGDYDIRMDFRFENGETTSVEATLSMGVPIHITISPQGGGYIEGDTCYKMGGEANITAVPNVGYEFVNWTENDDFLSTDSLIIFTVTGSRSLVANFKIKHYDITVSANPPEGGTALEDYFDIPHGTSVTVYATPNPDYTFINWTINDIPVSTDATYNFPATQSCNLVANFAYKTYYITTIPSPTIGGNTFGDGYYPLGDSATVSAIANDEYSFLYWTENSTIVSNKASYSFVVTESRTLVAKFSKGECIINVEIPNEDYGSVTGAGMYETNDTIRLEAIANYCYRFESWTIDGVVVSTDNPYIFIATESVNLVANFSALDFDTYAPILWCNTFMLNLKKLREDGYEFTGCLWYKNGIEEPDTRTINEFSYSAGPYEGDRLEFAPTYYMFELITKNFGNLCSSKKMIENCTFHKGLMAYPNPVWAGNQITVAGFTPNSVIYIYNQYGACVGSTVSAENTTTLTLNYPPGIYLIRSEHKTAKILIIK